MLPMKSYLCLSYCREINETDIKLSVQLAESMGQF